MRRCGATVARALLALLLPALLPACSPGKSRTGTPAAAAKVATPASAAFTDITNEAGLHAQHVNGAKGRFLYPEQFGPGAGFIDYDRDGRLDIVLVNGGALDAGARAGAKPAQPRPGGNAPALTLYHNDGNGRFTDVTARSGLTASLYGMGVAVGDYDNDGYDDLYVTGLGRSLLFHNEAGRTGAVAPATAAARQLFRDVSHAMGVDNAGHWATSAAWLDYDHDGRLDLFVCNYVRWSAEQEQTCQQGELRVYCGPLVYPADSCRLFRGVPGEPFRDVTTEAGIARTTGKSLGVAIWDLDGDGYSDIVVANDLTPNYLFRNNRDGTFREMGLEAGVAYGFEGMARSGMGVDIADAQNDGRCAILISDFAREPNACFCQQESPFQFMDRTYETGMGEASLVQLGFGLVFFDYDNDGWKDAFVANGHIQPDVARYEPGQAYAQEPLLFHNRHDGTFEEVHRQAAPAFATRMVGRGVARGDVDNDGAPDLLLAANNGPARLLRNTAGNGNAWLTIRLIGTKSNRDGIGAEVRVTAGGCTQRDQVRSGSSYLSASDLRLHFGLGTARQADRVEVRWPSGAKSRLDNVRADQMLEIVEGMTR